MMNPLTAISCRNNWEEEEELKKEEEEEQKRFLRALDHKVQASSAPEFPQAWLGTSSRKLRS
jgi:hypothetical protein